LSGGKNRKNDQRAAKKAATRTGAGGPVAVAYKENVSVVLNKGAKKPQNK